MIDEHILVNKAVNRDGESFFEGDEVTTDWHPDCKGRIFIVSHIYEYPNCSSGYTMRVHLKGDPERELKSVSTFGFDSDWFKKAIKEDDED